MPTALERLNSFRQKSTLERLNAFKEQPSVESTISSPTLDRLQNFISSQAPSPEPSRPSIFDTLRNTIGSLVKNKAIRAAATGGATLPFDYPEVTQKVVRGVLTPEITTKVAETVIPRLKNIPGETIGEKLFPEVPPEKFQTPFKAGLHTFTTGMLRDIANIYATPASYVAPKVAEIAGEAAFGALPKGAQRVLTTPISKLFQTRSPVKIADTILNAGSFDEALNLWKTVDQDIKGAVGRVIYRKNPGLAVRFTVGEPEPVVPLGLPAPTEVGKPVVAPPEVKPEIQQVVKPAPIISQPSQVTPAVTKEPWQMNYEDYLSQVSKERGENPELSGWREAVYKNHIRKITQALSEGKPVPPEVLKDYPDLVKQPIPPKISIPKPVGSIKTVESPVKFPENVFERPQITGGPTKSSIAYNIKTRAVLSEKNSISDGFLLELNPSEKDLSDFKQGIINTPTVNKMEQKAIEAVIPKESDTRNLAREPIYLITKSKDPYILHDQFVFELPNKEKISFDARYIRYIKKRGYDLYLPNQTERPARLVKNGKTAGVLMPLSKTDYILNELSQKAKSSINLASQSGQLNISLIPGVPETAQFAKDLGESFNAILRPYATGSVSKETAGILRENIGVMVRNLDIAEKSLNTARQAYDKRPNESNVAFIDKVEKGEIHADPMDITVSKQWRAISDKDVKDVQELGTGKLENFIENYFPHIWKDPQKAVDVFRAAASKRPFEGGKAFLKQRTIPTVSEGIALGLEPVSYNPVDLMLLKHREVQKYVMAHRTLNTLKEEGIAKFIRLGQEIPEGYRKIDDRIATVYSRDEEGQLILRGNYYAQQDAARIINNYLSPGLRGNFLYDVYRGAGNSLNQFQLGLSLFHLGFTSMDATISKFALALEKAYHGRFVSGLKDVSMTPFSPITNIIQGDRLLRAWYGNPKNELEAKIADYMAIAGGRAKMDKFYATAFSEKFKENLKAGKLIRALLQVPFAVVEQTSRPLLEWIVPRQKLGVFMDMVKFELEKNPNMPHEQLRRVMQNAWDSVDNRMGQLVYDNLFWNKVTKDLAMASVRSVGWNLGTVREIGGGVGEAGKLLNDLLKGKRTENTHKLAYILSLPIIVGLYGAIYQYLRTGQTPQELRDYYFPKNGRIDRNGDPARDSLPTYVKDIYHYFRHPVRTVLNKLNPINAAIYQMMTNKDFYGTKIRNEDDPLVMQLADEAKYVGTQFIPFGIRNVQKAVQPDIASKVLPFVGIVPAPYDINQTPAEEKAYEIMRSRMPIGGRTREEAEKAKMKAELRNNYMITKDETPLRSALHSGAISYQEYNTIQKGARIPVLERLTSHMTYQEVGVLLQVANAEEKAILIPIIKRKINNKLMEDISREQRMALIESRDKLLRITDPDKRDLATRRLRELQRMQQEHLRSMKEAEAGVLR